MRVPQHLKHKPIIAVDNYSKIDGMYANKSVAKALSVGRSQWDEKQISAKVWRHTTGDDNGKWSRQSEELPLHRVLDLAILIISLYNESESKTFLNEIILNESELEYIKTFLNSNKDHMNKRLKKLQELLKEINLNL